MTYYHHTIHGNNYNNTLQTTTGNDCVYGYGGNDWIIMYKGDDKVDGGTGSDTLSYAGAACGVQINLSIAGWQNTGVGWLQQTSIENLAGSRFNDTLIGNAYANTLYGAAGNDQLAGLGGNDVLNGGTGNDCIDGGAGNDTASFIDSGRGVVVDLSNGGWQNTGDGNDKLISIENLIGSRFADSLKGNAGSNMLAGEGGNDKLEGNGGSDRYYGGAGNDLFQWNFGDAATKSCDVIEDFQQGDRIWTKTFQLGGHPIDFDDVNVTFANGMTYVSVKDCPEAKIALRGHVQLDAADFVC